MKKAIDVDSYINSQPEDIKTKLKHLRKIIKTVAKEAVEKISYGMPYYEYKGRLAYFAIQSKHIGLYIPPPIIKQHEKELKDYKTTKSAIHLLIDKPLPLPLIKKLIRARMRWNYRKEKKK